MCRRGLGKGGKGRIWRSKCRRSSGKCIRGGSEGKGSISAAGPTGPAAQKGSSCKMLGEVRETKAIGKRRENRV